MFCRLKDFRRIATRYDRLATNFLVAVCLAATVTFWLWVVALRRATAWGLLFFFRRDRSLELDGQHGTRR